MPEGDAPPTPSCLGLVAGEGKWFGCAEDFLLRACAAIHRLWHRAGYCGSGAEPRGCHLLRGGLAHAPWPLGGLPAAAGRRRGACALGLFRCGKSRGGGAGRGSSRATRTRSGSGAAVLLQRPGGGGCGGDQGGCGGDSGGNRRCPAGAAAGSAATRTAVEGPAGCGAEQLRHGWHCVSRSAGASPRREARLSPERWVASAGKSPFPLLRAAEH